MKKIFTLIAMASLTLGAQAQDAKETLVLDAEGTYTDNQVLETANTKLTLGNDQKSASWTRKTAKLPAEFLSDLGQEGTFTDSNGDTQEGPFYVNIAGGNNPKDQIAGGKGSGFNATEGKTTANLPQNGTYYILDAQEGGTFNVGIILNANKEFYLIDATDAAADETETYLQVALPESNIKTYSLINADGAIDLSEGSAALDPANATKGGIALAEKLTGYLQFYATAGHKYYFFCSGSKLGFFGYTFTPGAPAGLSEVPAVLKEATAVYNLGGQQVSNNAKGIVVKNGKKMLNK